MNDPRTVPTSSYERIVGLRQELIEAIGGAKVAELHRENLALDLAATFLPPVAFAATFVALGNRDLSTASVVCLVLINGWLLTVLGLVAHDVAVHRVRWGRALSWAHSAIAFVFVLVPGTGYAKAHIKHHAKLGTSSDSESYKMLLDSPGKRIVFATLPGFLYWTRAKRSADDEGYMEVANPDAATSRRLRIERALMLLLLLSAAALGYLVDFRQVLLGYLVPLAVVAPSLNAVRIVLEHAESDDNSKYWLGTNYRCGLVSRLAFLAGAGDCHVVHHIFPKIPFYQCRRAADLIRPYISARGASERTDFGALMVGWFVRGYAHRSPWPISGGSTTALSSSTQVSVKTPGGDQRVI